MGPVFVLRPRLATLAGAFPSLVLGRRLATGGPGVCYQECASAASRIRPIRFKQRRLALGGRSSARRPARTI
eukprot:11206768-Lingulodinium_polyedra.AAC.1